MSEVEKSIPTASGDAAVVETMKNDCIGNSSQSIARVEPTRAEIVSGNAEEVAASLLNARNEIQCSIEAGGTNALVDEIVNLSTHAAEVNNITVRNADIATENSKEDASTIRADTQNLVAEVKSSTMVTVQEAASQLVDEEKTDKSKNDTMQAKDNDATLISKLEVEVRKRTKERDSYRKKLEDTEKKLTTLRAAYDAATCQGGDENTLQRSVEQLRGQLAQTALMYEERNRVVANQENQINALNNQVSSLKEVVSITRDLLQIRNMEVKQLQTEVDNMEKKIAEERNRHNAMINKMDTAMRLNADLKKEYETQLSLFQSLREKYGEKITLLSEEKRALETTISTSK